jgi:hypothetical protein
MVADPVVYFLIYPQWKRWGGFLFDSGLNRSTPPPLKFFTLFSAVCLERGRRFPYVCDPCNSLKNRLAPHLRVSSFCVGLAVGVMSLVAMVRKWRES